ncbi:acyl-CoA dehydrogenase family protein [Desulfoluna butyratoxydans]|uniref:Acyl-coa dehydrogenase/oxidase c-terminal n=1 Tax=Desulfoluna butyratoxydans TaxID=231438 RepID=A0A4U8YPU9_9BACT|nr:acyl-CoA dehydrogenase family protein [Desulfoluna butyratoxydans]VFQ46275.1 acyl-coa dehydrogenase/oxidase c-terminal [Desulfoluna butyratoxydans]
MASAAEASPLTHLTHRETRFQTEVRAFVREHVSPRVFEMDRQEALSRELIADLHGHNYMNIEIPGCYGGRDGSFFESVIAIEEFARVDPSVAVFVDVQNTLVNNAVSRWGDEAQKDVWLRGLARGTTGAFSITEKHAGSDAYALSATARRVEGGYVLNGEKHLVTNAAEAETFIVYAKLEDPDAEDQLTAFLVNAPETPGLRILDREEKMGIRASSTCPLVFEDTFIPEDQVLGRPGQGKQVALETLTDGRVGIAAQMAGLASGALDAAVAYAGERRQFGRRICDFQGVHFLLAELATSVEAARLLVYNAARLRDQGRSQGEYFKAASMAKYFAAEVAGKVTSRVLDIFSGAGYLKNTVAEKFYRDAKIGTIYEGTAHMQLRSIAKMIIGFREQ